MRYGIRGPLWIGLVLFSVGLLLFARTPVNGSYVANVLPSMLLLGIAEGLASTPILLSAMRDVHVSETGSASGIANTAFMLGGAMGLAVLSKLADTRVDELLVSGADRLVALNGGYHLAFFVGALLTAVAAAVAASFLRSPRVETASRCSELAPRDL